MPLLPAITPAIQPQVAAEQSVSQPCMTVVQIAETLNYSNVQNFIRFFSKKVGMTPGKYRKDYQNEKK